MSLLSSASFFFFFFSLRSVAFHQPRCSAHGAAELAASVIEVCVVFCLIVCLCAVWVRVPLCCWSRGRSSLVLAACSAEDICRCPMSTRSQPHNGARSQHAPTQRKTGPKRKFWNRKIVHHNNWDTATSMVVFAKMRRW